MGEALIPSEVGDSYPERPHLVDLPCFVDTRGNLTAIEASREVPFLIRRVYYLHDVPGGASRGGHAHRELEQLIVAVSGSFDVILQRGMYVETFTLNRAHIGLYIPPMHWRELDNFSSGSVCLVLASQYYSEDDYMFDQSAFLKETRRE